MSRSSTTINSQNLGESNQSCILSPQLLCAEKNRTKLSLKRNPPPTIRNTIATTSMILSIKREPKSLEKERCSRRARAAHRQTSPARGKSRFIEKQPHEANTTLILLGGGVLKGAISNLQRRPLKKLAKTPIKIEANMIFHRILLSKR
ncbi:hypothetical protein SAMN02745171_00716 [Porphyromonas circumdentaria]|uniref:Uncharacterized protein n=1 Tax=Porphyromonas circumdentaria TaxID=29524 RepID=A0A1T4MCW9_9PORP|nr:hypothetical protein SAMN02745171_00716 [Porphyromonas circumdentaria]